MKAKLWALAWAFLIAVSPVRAEVSPADKAAAEALFDRGLFLMRTGKYMEACKRLEESQAIDPGIGTMLYLADCYEKMGRTASAWALFREAASLASAANQGERAEAGRRRAAQLEPKLSRLTVLVSEAQRVPGLEIRTDGRVLPQSTWNEGLPVDPGDHRVEARAPGYNSFEKVVNVAAGAAEAQVLIPQLEPAPPGSVAAAEPAPAKTAGAEPVPVSAQPAEERGLSKQKIAAIAVAGAGVAALGIGAIYGGLAIKRNNESKEFCQDNGDECSSQKGVDLSDDALKAARVSNGMLISGGILAVAGAVLFFVEPKRDRRSVGAYVGPREAGVTWGGAF